MDTSQGKGEFNSMEKRVVLGTRPPHKDRVVLNCPRCDSPNTKFCYYNNYSLSQPRYFCKSCRRYWTEGGTLRNVPVGGGSRKNKRALPLPNSSSSSCTNSLSSPRNFPCPSKAVPIPVRQSGAPGSLSSRNPSFVFQDLALAGNFLLPGTEPLLPTEKFLEHGRSRAAFPDLATETGVSLMGLALGSNPSLTVTPHFTTPTTVEPLVFPIDFPLEAAMQRVAGMDTREVVELQVGADGGGEKLQTQGDQSNHQGLWGGGYFGAGPW